MKEEKSVDINNIMITYQDMWQDLFQEYIWVFKDYTEFNNCIKNFLKKISKNSPINKVSKEQYLDGAHKYLKRIIFLCLHSNKNIGILLNYINSNINPNQDAYQEIKKFIKLIKSSRYTPSPNEIIELIDKSEIFKEVLAKLINDNMEKIKNYGLEKTFEDDLIILLVEIYCTLNNVVLNDIDNYRDEYADEEILPMDILNEQKTIRSSYEERLEDKDYSFKKEEIKEDISDFMPMGADAFISEIKRKKLEVLSKDQEYELLTRIKNGDEEAYKYFYEHNCRLVISIVKRYRNYQVDYEDLLQEGCIGLMMAIERFEVARGLKFSTYATWWIKQAVIRALNKYSKKTGVSINKNLDLIQYRKKLEALSDKLGRKPTNTEIVEYLKIPLIEVEENNQLLLTNFSINHSINDEDDTELGEFICDERVEIEKDYITDNLVLEIQNLFRKAHLTDQEILVLNYRWGLNGCEEKTLVEIGKLFGVSRERARQYEANAIKKLRKYTGMQDFALYLDSPDKALDRLRKLVKWHLDNPRSFAIYDIDVSEVVLEEKKETKIPKNKDEGNYIYKLFKEYRKEDIDIVLDSLTEEEKKIIAIRNEYFNNPTLYSPWNNEKVKQAFKNILTKIHYRLKNNEKKVKLSTIFDFSFCKNYSQEEVKLAIEMLDSRYKKIIYLRYGNDLIYPTGDKNWDFKKYGDIFYEEIIPQIITNLKLIHQQNKKLTVNVSIIMQNEEIDESLKEIYIKALMLLKLPELRILIKDFSEKEAIILAIYLLKYFENITLNIEDFIDILQITKNGLNDCSVKALLFIKENVDILNILKNKLDHKEKISNKVKK